MSHFNADAMTAQPVWRNNGLNVQRATFSVFGTLSGSTTVALMPLPAGSRVVDVMATKNNNDSAAAITVFSRIGGNTAATYIASAAPAATVAQRADANGLWTRHSASAQLWAQFTNIAGGGSSATQIHQVICTYIAREDGD